MKMKWNRPRHRPIMLCNFVVGLLFSIIRTSTAYTGSDEIPLTTKDVLKLRNEVKSMFYHAYNGYMEYAIPYDELRPLTCDGHDTWGSYSLTLIDALDTLAVMENHTEFQRVYSLICQRTNFESDINVSVFETNIRIVGGLLSGHLLARRMGVSVEESWPCKGPLLALAVDAATRLLPAFDTPTGMPYGTVNLKYGVPDQETPVTCAAGVGTFIIEFGTLSKLTGDPLFEEVALRALHALWERRSRLNLIGNHIDVLTGHWTGSDAGIGAGVDSFYEYLAKGSFLFQRPELMEMFTQARRAVDFHLRHDDWYLWKSMQRGQITMAVFQSLEAFWPGVLTLVGDVDAAQKTLYNYHQVLKQYGFHPEFYSIPQAASYSKRSGYPLRPEFVESLMYLYQATKDHTFLKMGADLLVALEHSTKTKCGYATVDNVADHTLDNRMESFFLAETTKYLYLLFNEDHWLHDTGQRGRPLKVGGRYCVVEAGGYFFNTEAHPIDSGALACCSSPGGEDFALSQEDIMNLVLDPTLFVAGHRGKSLATVGEENVDRSNQKTENGNKEADEDRREEVEQEKKVEEMEESEVEKVLEREEQLRLLSQDGMNPKANFKYNAGSDVKGPSGVETSAKDDTNDQGMDPSEPVDGEEPLIKTILNEGEDGPSEKLEDTQGPSSETVDGVEPLIKTIIDEGKDGASVKWGTKGPSSETGDGQEPQIKTILKEEKHETSDKLGNTTTQGLPEDGQEPLIKTMLQEEKDNTSGKWVDTQAPSSESGDGEEPPIKTILDGGKDGASVKLEVTQGPSSEPGDGEEPLIKTILEEEKDGNESEYEGSVSGIPWGPRFTAASETRHKDAPDGEMAGVATSVSSSKFSLRTESRIVQKEVDPDAKKLPRKEFNINEFRSGVRGDVLSLASNWTDRACPSVLSCPVSFIERFSFKGQMVGA